MCVAGRRVLFFPQGPDTEVTTEDEAPTIREPNLRSVREDLFNIMKQNTSICGSLMVVWTLFYTIFDVNGIKKCVPLTFIAAGLATRTIHHEM